MNQYKDFQGKTLDDAIREACTYYGVAREKLEIDILSDAKSGIFGLVGAKKASIRAARTTLPERVPLSVESASASVENASAKDTSFPSMTDNQTSSAPRPPQAPREESAYRAQKERPQRDQRGAKTDPPPQEQERARQDGGTRGKAGGSAEASAPSESGKARRGDERKQRDAHRSSSGQDKKGSGDPQVEPNAPLPDLSQDSQEAFPEFSLVDCDRDELFAVVSEVVQRLTEPIVGAVPCTVTLYGNRVCVSLDCGEASGLLVGREGQTLASIQYLASRIITKRIGGSLRLHIDAGKYRERQDDKLKDLALSLAERAKATRRAQSTRPLSAYQRRLIHLALEEDEAVQTHSKGDGPQRRVIIQLKSPSRRGHGKDETEASLEA